MPILLVLGLVMAVDAIPPCDGQEAIAASIQRVAEGGPDGHALQGEVDGPWQTWAEFVRKKPLFVQLAIGRFEAVYVRWKISGHRYYFVHLTPRSENGVVYLDGSQWSFVDAVTCKVLVSGDG